MFGRSRWAALGAVVAVVAGGGLLTASAAGSPRASSFVPITPCRLFDTRTTENVGSRATPLGANETFVVPVWGTNGNCTIPTGATGVSISVAIINPSASSYLTVFPADAARPVTSNLNWVSGQAPTPNAVTAALSADGRLGLYNLAGTVDLLVDIVGYYELSTSGPAGPEGPAGPDGPAGAKGDTGDPGPRPAQIVWVATSGGDFTTVKAALQSITDNSSAKPYLVKVAPGTYTETSTTLLKDYVDIEGSGEDTTSITCVCGGGSTNSASATLAAVGVLHAQVRNLSVANTGGFLSIAIFNDNVTSTVSFDQVTAIATNGTNNFGFYNTGASPSATLTNVTINVRNGAQTWGIVHKAGAATWSNITVTASGGTQQNIAIHNDNGPVLIRDSFLSGTFRSVFNGATVHITNTVFDGPTFGVGALNCIAGMTTSLAPFTCT